MNQLTAVAPGPLELTSGEEQFLTFQCAGGQYGSSIFAVKEIIQYGQVTDVPLMPAEIRGVINLRGQVVPVIDLAVRFGRPPARICKRSCIVIMEVDRGERTQEVGVLVDAVNEVINIAAAEINPAPHFGTQVRADFIRGVATLNQRLVILLDVQHTFDFTELSAAVAAFNLEAELVS
ncbi:chemotaxis protein CheW [Pseudomarimonas arenosa]|uniref:Purine-binding chemotaxis protein CheW n=1 Tax=Pseudomarimonas arenosa TaxID=2774145 RepID=A0AAW3ZRM4_9GAMM|nr:chemotaxis protein CheW [Pseudomarimonas arenosa]MBD8527197.1 purine-binding chemotaxis protein CheW [Pseudomarimonas arenosa]